MQGYLLPLRECLLDKNYNSMVMVLKFIYFVLALFPFPFLFHYYEYEQRKVLEEEADFLLIGTIFFVLVTSIFSKAVKLRYFLIVSVVTTLRSLYLAINFLPNDGAWFKPFGRNKVIVLTGILYGTGQLIRKGIISSIKQGNKMT
ncbi:hypothetical protein [Halobacillus sp. B23F22_1]|uniref:hypothetical protein n=1 Tax=Halobacillus sp. B23F22_1 TaxID=3459514 RepID=UPI00373EA0D4